MRVLIIGNGYVGKAYAELFARRYHVLIDDPSQGFDVPEMLKNNIDLAVVCVPTPMGEDGKCDTSIVEEVVRGLPRGVRRVLIKSTVPPGTTQQLAIATGRPLVFSPEYIGEGGYHVPAPFPAPKDPASHGWVILGCTDDQAGVTHLSSHRHAGDIADMLLPIMGPTTRVRIMGSTEAELVKYFENYWLAAKVTFVNEQRRICEALGVDYHTVREGWLDDPRVGLSHSAAFATRAGFEGKCLPKDTAALEAFCRHHGIPTPLLTAVIKVNAGKP